MQTEVRYVCDSCGEEIEIPFDVSAGARQAFVEDCPVCCNANVIEIQVDDNGSATAHARAEQDRS